MDDEAGHVLPLKGQGADETVIALRAAGERLEELTRELRAVRDAKPGYPNGKARDFLLGLLSIFIVALAAFLWGAHTDIALTKNNQEQLREDYQSLRDRVDRIHTGGD